MEALAVVGLTSNILQFIEFSFKLVRKTNEARGSASLVPKDLDDATAAGANLHRCLRGLKLPAEADDLTPDEQSLITLAKDCRAVNVELNKLFEKVKGAAGSSSFAVSLRSVWHHDKLSSLEKRIESYRDQILSLVSMTIAEEVFMSHELLKTLTTSNEHAHDALLAHLDKTRDALVDAIDKHEQTSSDEMEKIRAMLEDMMRSTKRADLHGQVLDWLHYPELGVRERNIANSHQGTFKWMLYPERQKDNLDSDSDSDSAASAAADAFTPSRSDDSSMNFPWWLEAGTGVYYISGKAGSGKSTLMKYLSKSKRTSQHLETWAHLARKKLVFARFFFWRSGTEIQRSIEGLYRGLLWEILREVPEATLAIFPDMASQSGNHVKPRALSLPPDLEILQGALERVIAGEIVTQAHRICIFIDGLDEYDGDHWQLSKQLKTWCNSEDLKLCLSSRPRHDFHKFFATSGCEWVKLNELTEQDIKHYIEDTFASDERVTEARQAGKKYDDLVESIICRADGVFLWVILVVRRLLTGIGNECTMAQLEARLLDVPDGLNAMFNWMLAQIDKADKAAVARDLLLVTLLDPPFPGIHALADQIAEQPDTSDRILKGSLYFPRAPDNCQKICHLYGRRIVSRCQGLLEMEDSGPRSFPSCHSISPIHRTLHDYLHEYDVVRTLAQTSETHQFNPFRLQAQYLSACVSEDTSITGFVCSCEACTTNFPPRLIDRATDIVRIHFESEKSGLGPLTAEIDAWVERHQLRASACSRSVTSIDSTFPRTPIGVRDRVEWITFHYPPGGIGQAVILSAVQRPSSPCVVDLVQHMLRMEPRLLSWMTFDLLLSIASHELFYETPWCESVTRLLSTDWGLSLNQGRGSCGLVYEGSTQGDSSRRKRHDRKNSTDNRSMFNTPTWTTWSLFLYTVSRQRELRFNPTTRNPVDPNIYRQWIDGMIGAGADPTVCFVGVIVSFVAASSIRPDIASVSGPCFTDLATMVAYWGHGELTGLPQIASENSSKIHGIVPMTASELLSMDDSSASFILLKVAPFGQLQEVDISDFDKDSEKTPMKSRTLAYYANLIRDTKRNPWHPHPIQVRVQ